MTTPADKQIPTDKQARLLADFMYAIWEERLRAYGKHGKTSMEQANPLAHRRASILLEEAAECARALNDFDGGVIHLWTREGDGPGMLETAAEGDVLDKELIQTASMAYTWWANRRDDRLDVTDPRKHRSWGRDVLTIRGVLAEVLGDERSTHEMASKILAALVGGGLL